MKLNPTIRLSKSYQVIDDRGPLYIRAAPTRPINPVRANAPTETVPRVAPFLLVLLEPLWLGDAPLELGLELPLEDLGAVAPDVEPAEDGLAPAAELEEPADAGVDEAAEPDEAGDAAELEPLEPLDVELEPPS